VIKEAKMKKVIVDNLGYVLGWMETTKKRGTCVEVADTAKFAHTGYVAEPLWRSDRCWEGRTAEGQYHPGISNELKELK
jgi:hypothetical protein